LFSFRFVNCPRLVLCSDYTKKKQKCKAAVQADRNQSGPGERGRRCGMKKSSVFKLRFRDPSATMKSGQAEPNLSYRRKTMEQTYNLNELAIMTGFTTRTLRNYLNQGLL
jgi:hypothetical protein